MENTTVYIPKNFTDSGKILGMFNLRNVAEAIILCLPLLLIITLISPFGLTGTLILATVFVVSVGGFALIGIHDYSLLPFVRLPRRWRKNKRILIYRGSQWVNVKKKRVR